MAAPSCVFTPVPAMRRPSDLTRREFSVALAAVTLTACARPAPVVSPAPVATPEPMPAAAVRPTPAPAAQDDPNAAVAEALFTVVAARFGAHITDDQRASVRTDILNSVRTAQRIRTTPLTNADDPFSVCVAPIGAAAAPRSRRRRA